MKKVLVGLVVVVGFAVVAPQAFAARILVDKDKVQCPNADFTSIQAAVAAALPADTIKVCPDLYNEDVTVNKPRLTLVGADGVPDCTILTAADPTKDSIVDGVSFSFSLANREITLAGFVVQGAQIGIQTSDAFSGYRITSNIAQNNSVRGINFLSSGTSQSRVDHNCLRTNGSSGLQSEVGNLRNALIDHNSTFNNGIAGLDFSGAGVREYVTVTRNSSVGDGFIGYTMTNSIGSAITHNDARQTPDVFPSGAAIVIGGSNNGLDIAYNNIEGGIGDGIRFNKNLFVPVFPSPNVGLDVTNNTITRVAMNGIQVDSNEVNLSVFSNNNTSVNGQNGIILFASNTNNRILDNNADKNGANGIHAAGASGNTFADNHMFLNVQFDARDDNRPSNTWTGNHCDTDSPPGTICGVN